MGSPKARIDDLVVKRLRVINSITPDYAADQEFETVTATTSVETDTIVEHTSATGVTIDGVQLKDNAVTASGGFVGDVTGNVIGGAKNVVAAVTASGAIAVPTVNKTFFITKSSAGAAMTIVNPTATTHDGLRLTFMSTTAQAHSLDNSAGAGFFSSGGSSKDVATWGGAIGDCLIIEAYQGKWYIISSTNITLG